MALVFRLFRETGSAFAVVQRFAERGFRFPKRAYGGAWDGKLIWGRLTHSRVLRILKNPSYAGMYVFGRFQYRVQISRCDVLDPVITEEVFKALQPAELELALGALRELETRDQAMMRQWQMRLQRAEYEAALAERRYEEVDPSNRLVATSTLERRWNDALLQLQDLKKQAAEFQQQKARVMTPEQKEKVLALARDLPRLWHAASTQAKDRKRICGC